jgi:TIR domain
MDQPETAEQHKTKVFISYSRVDGAFAEKLRSGLIARGFEAYLDKEDILPGERYSRRTQSCSSCRPVRLRRKSAVGRLDARWN